MTEPPSTPPTYIVYDGDCPLCATYIKLVRLRDAIGPVEMIDARSDHPVVEMLWAKGYDLDEGMALVENFGVQGFEHDDEAITYGPDCVHKLALLTTPSGPFNRATAALLRSQRRANALYPLFRAGRNAALKFLGKPQIKAKRAST
ncbi:MAG: DCC1-like thiol-disulfide oxidoreductase family protein [Pseudomonadota bacterium]